MARALFIIDVQNDFVEGGACAVFGGQAVAEGIASLLGGQMSQSYDYVVASRDWHDPDSDNGGHFALAGVIPDYAETWPEHCVANTTGAAYHGAIDQTRIDIHVRKGQGRPAFSIFEGITPSGSLLSDEMRSLDINEVDVVGIATDHCVFAAASDALDLGAKVRVLRHLTAGVNRETSEAALTKLESRGVIIVQD